MASIEKISIALPPEMVAQLRQAVATGEYASSSEVVRDALRAWKNKRDLEQQGVAELHRLVQEAINDDSPGLDADEVMGRLQRKYRALANAARGEKIPQGNIEK